MDVLFLVLIDWRLLTMKENKATNQDYENYKKKLQENIEITPWIKSELEFFKSFKVNVDYATALQQVITLNNKYRTHLSLGLSSEPDESSELANFIVSDSFQSRILSTNKEVVISLVIDLANAAKSRGRFNLSFASKYCHHCNPNMYPIYDSENVKYLCNHYSYDDKKDYNQFYDSYSKFCKDIGIDLEKASDKAEGFWIDKFINNIEKNSK
jgi:hypothetical protein